MTSEPIDTFLQYLRDCEQRIHMAEAEEQEAGDRTQDILHTLELEEHSYHECAKLAKELRVVRQTRRAAKDAIMELTPVVEWINTNRVTIKNLEQLLGAVRKAERRNENRIYTPRAKG